MKLEREDLRSQYHYISQSQSKMAHQIKSIRICKFQAFNPRDRSDLSSRAKLAKLQDQLVHDHFTTLTEAWVLGDCDSTHHYDVAIKTLKECATPKH